MEQQYRFGYPEAKRIATITELKGRSEEKQRIHYQGKYDFFDVIEVPIELLVYRIENIRTKNLQKEWIATHPEHPSDFFTRDPFSIEAQEAQHDLLVTLVNKENLLTTFKKGDVQQMETLICSDNGIVVNGNRRLCAWRELYYSEPLKYKRFQMIRIAVLPNHDKRGMYDLEVALQIQKDMKAEYAWHAIAADCKEKVESGMIDQTDLAKMMGKSVDVINKMIQCYDYAAEFLKRSGHPDEWSLVDQDEYAFKEIIKSRQNLKNKPADKELFLAVADSCLSAPAKGERLYKRIPQIEKNLQSIADGLVKDLQIDIDEEIDDDLAILGGGDQSNLDVRSSQIAAAIRSLDDPEKVVDVVNKTLTTCEELEKEREKQSFVFDYVVKAATYLNTAVSNLGDNMSKEGVDRHLTSIESSCALLRQWLK